MLKEGDKAPAFSLPDQNGKKVSLKDLKGKNVVLYFYPKDDTSGCTREAQDFTQNLGQFKKKNSVIFGISKDSEESHQKFIGKYGLKVDLLSDPDMSMIKAYEVWGKKMNYGREYMGIIRTTFLISPDGKIEKIWKKVKVNGHVDEVAGCLV